MLEPEALAEHRLEVARRAAWQSAPARRARARRATGKPLVSVQTCRSCTSRPPARRRSRGATVVWVDVFRREPRGRSASSRGAARTPPRTSARRRAGRRSGRARSQPVSEDQRPGDRGADEREQVGGDVQERAADVQALPARAREEPGRDQVDDDRRPARRPARRRRGRRPAKPDGGSRRTRSRCPRARAASPFAWAERISSRRKPYVHRPCAGRVASVAATSAKPSASASEIMCPASASSASDPARMPGDDLGRHQGRRSARARREQELPVGSSRRCAWSWACIRFRLTRRARNARLHWPNERCGRRGTAAVLSATRRSNAR